MDVLGYYGYIGVWCNGDSLSNLYIIYIYVCTLPSAHVDVEAKKSTTNMDVHLVKTIKI